jgi:hypothetical protein
VVESQESPVQRSGSRSKNSGQRPGASDYVQGMPFCSQISDKKPQSPTQQSLIPAKPKNVPCVSGIMSKKGTPMTVATEKCQPMSKIEDVPSIDDETLLALQCSERLGSIEGDLPIETSKGPHEYHQPMGTSKARIYVSSESYGNNSQNHQIIGTEISVKTELSSTYEEILGQFNELMQYPEFRIIMNGIRDTGKRYLRNVRRLQHGDLTPKTHSKLERKDARYLRDLTPAFEWIMTTYDELSIRARTQESSVDTFKNSKNGTL